MTAYRDEIEGEVDYDYLKALPIVGRQPKTEKEEDYLREICEFEFINLKEPGVMHRFSYGNTKKNKRFTFFHGGSYRVPRFLARHVESCSTPLYEWRPDGTGRLIKKPTGNDPRFQIRQVFSA